MTCFGGDETTWLQERITATQALIVAYEAAILALSTGSVQSYSLDTGQTRQTVTKQQISQLKNTLQELYNTYTTLSARLCGTGMNVRPVY
jgi:hypothetical protein